jgi:ATP:corrinoid adenosyltransferase
MAVQFFPHDAYDRLRGAEQRVLRFLEMQLSGDVEVFCRVERYDGIERRELDFLVVFPGKGLVFLEVKGGQIKYEAQDMQQLTSATGQWHSLNIVDQMDEERRLLRKAVRAGINRRYKLPAMVGLLVTPDTPFAHDAVLPGMERDAVVGRGDMGELVNMMLTKLNQYEDDHRFSERDRIGIHKAFVGTEFDYQSFTEAAQARGQVVERLTAQQSFVLDLLADNSRLYVEGGPGTGKTVLALEQASRLAEQGLRVGIVCYNRGLSHYLKKRVSQLPQNSRPAFVGNALDDLPVEFGVNLPVRDDGMHFDTYYRQVIPNALLAHANALSNEQKFDAWIVDEAQDFTMDEWETLKAVLRNPDTGLIHVFGDPDQDLFEASGEFGANHALPWFYARGRLVKNLRSTRQIGKTLAKMYAKDSDPAGVVEGLVPEVFIIDENDDVEEIAESYARYIIAEGGWLPGNLAVITTRKLHSKHRAAKEQDELAYWKSYLDASDIFYSHVSSFKGLEREMVIVAVNGIPSDADGLQQLYVAMSRAKDDLVLIGTKEDLSHLGDVLKTLPVMEDWRKA